MTVRPQSSKQTDEDPNSEEPEGDMETELETQRIHVHWTSTGPSGLWCVGEKKTLLKVCVFEREREHKQAMVTWRYWQKAAGANATLEYALNNEHNRQIRENRKYPV